ncbi:hypothetical protein GCM10025786_08620 [Nocardioides caeni]
MPSTAVTDAATVSGGGFEGVRPTVGSGVSFTWHTLGTGSLWQCCDPTDHLNCLIREGFLGNLAEAIVKPFTFAVSRVP